METRSIKCTVESSPTRRPETARTEHLSTILREVKLSSTTLRTIGLRDACTVVKSPKAVGTIYSAKTSFRSLTLRGVTNVPWTSP